MPAPSVQQVIDKIIEQCAAEFAASKSKVFNYWPVYFQEGENITALRSEDDSDRVNAWMFAEAGFERAAQPRDATRGITEGRGKRVLSVRIRCWHVYEFERLSHLGLPSSQQVSRNVHAFADRVDSLPKLGFRRAARPEVAPTDEFAQYVEGHDGVQCPLIDDFPFEEVNAHVAQCHLWVHLIKPLGAA